jgi:hypothetical protein
MTHLTYTARCGFHHIRGEIYYILSRIRTDEGTLRADSAMHLIHPDLV